jgi:uncharacterized cupin superfamily protein
MSDYEIMRAAEAPDYTGGSESPFYGYARPMESEQLGVNLRVLAAGATNVPPGGDPTAGHSHNEVEELYFVVDGEVTVKAGDEEVKLGPRDAILLAQGTPRAARNESGEEAALLMISVKMADPRADSHAHEGFWPEA